MTALEGASANQHAAGNSAPPELLSAKQGADLYGICLAAFWQGVAAGRIPTPVYPMPRSPRWFRAELLAALKATRALPSAAKAARIAARRSKLDTPKAAA